MTPAVHQAAHQPVHGVGAPDVLSPRAVPAASHVAVEVLRVDEPVLPDHRAGVARRLPRQALRELHGAHVAPLTDLVDLAEHLRPQRGRRGGGERGRRGEEGEHEEHRRDERPGGLPGSRHAAHPNNGFGAPRACRPGGPFRSPRADRRSPR